MATEYVVIWRPVRVSQRHWANADVWILRVMGQMWRVRVAVTGNTHNRTLNISEWSVCSNKASNSFFVVVTIF